MDKYLSFAFPWLYLFIFQENSAVNNVHLDLNVLAWLKISWITRLTNFNEFKPPQFFHLTSAKALAKTNEQRMEQKEAEQQHALLQWQTLRQLLVNVKLWCNCHNRSCSYVFSYSVDSTALFRCGAIDFQFREMRCGRVLCVLLCCRRVECLTPPCSSEIVMGCGKYMTYMYKLHTTQRWQCV